MTTETMQAAALKRLAETLARSVGQHERAIRSGFAELRRVLGAK